MILLNNSVQPLCYITCYSAISNNILYNCVMGDTHCTVSVLCYKRHCYELTTRARTTTRPRYSARSRLKYDNQRALDMAPLLRQRLSGETFQFSAVAIARPVVIVIH